MFTAFVLSMALANPLPPGAQPAAAPSGPAPRLMELKADANGKVMIHILRTEIVKAKVAKADGGEGTVEVPVTKPAVVDLSEIKDLKITTADGKKVEVADAVKKIKDGAVVVISADGKPVGPAFLKVLKDDALILASPELAGATAAPGGVRPARAEDEEVAPGATKVKPGQVQVAPPAAPPK